MTGLNRSIKPRGLWRENQLTRAGFLGRNGSHSGHVDGVDEGGLRARNRARWGMGAELKRRRKEPSRRERSGEREESGSGSDHGQEKYLRMAEGLLAGN